MFFENEKDIHNTKKRYVVFNLLSHEKITYPNFIDKSGSFFVLLNLHVENLNFEQITNYPPPPTHMAAGALFEGGGDSKS